jgi:ribonuclease T1
VFDTDGPRPKPAPPPSRPVLVVPRPHPPRRGRSLRMVTAGLVLAAGTLISPAVALARSAPEHLSASLPSDTADAAEDGVVTLQFWRCLGFPRARDWYTWRIPAPGCSTVFPASDSTEPAHANREVPLPSSVGRSPKGRTGADTVRTKTATDHRELKTAGGPGAIRSLPMGQEHRLAGRGADGQKAGGRPVDLASVIGPAALASDGATSAGSVSGHAVPNGPTATGSTAGKATAGVASSKTSVMVRSIEGVYAFAGGRYRNHEGRLPLGTTYYEYDVYPRNRGTARDGYRLVVDAAGETAWFTPNHYLDFYRVA